MVFLLMRQLKLINKTDKIIVNTEIYNSIGGRIMN
jgi:hypothetical protein